MKSMTGYGSAEGRVGEGRVFIEIRSVNHRYCDIQLKIPPKMNPLDPLFRKLIKDNIERGKIEVYLKERRGIAAAKDLSLDIALAKKYHRCLEELKRELGPSKKDVHLLEVIDARELITIEDLDVDYSRYWNSIKGIAFKAINKLDGMRSQEGVFLLKDQRARLKKVSDLVGLISRQSGVGLKKYQARLRAKLVRGLGSRIVSKEKIDSELAFLAEKVDIAEELTRLKSHLSQYQQILGQKGAVGRQLDFLLQEMNREVNTLGAKASDAKISGHVISVKSELEKLREQVQNVE